MVAGLLINSGNLLVRIMSITRLYFNECSADVSWLVSVLVSLLTCFASIPHPIEPFTTSLVYYSKLIADQCNTVQ